MIGNEDCIVIGRCGNFIFKDRKDLVTVFLHGSLSDRIANAAEEENLSMSQAEEFVHTTDDCRVHIIVFTPDLLGDMHRSMTCALTHAVSGPKGRRR